MTAAIQIEPQSVPESLSVSVDPSALTAAIKAVREFASKDETRFALTHVYAERKGSALHLTATDGHTLCQVEITTESGWGASTAFLDSYALDRLLLQAKQGKYLSSAEFHLDATNRDALTFPEYSRVIPTRANGGEQGSRVAGFNGAYLARIGSVQKHLKASGAILSFGVDDLTPLRADIKSDAGTAVVVIMPMRR
jgi:hypothetical protein